MEKIEDEIILVKHRLENLHAKLEVVVNAIAELKIVLTSESSKLPPKYVDSNGLKLILPIFSDDTIKAARESGDIIFKKIGGKYYYPVEQFTLSTLLTEKAKKEEKKKLRIAV